MESFMQNDCKSNPQKAQIVDSIRKIDYNIKSAGHGGERMVIGTGIDIIEVDRIGRAAEKEEFLKRIFTQHECDYYMKCNCSSETLSGIFAAKEATAKALGCGFNGIGWRDIEILHDKLDKPYVKLWNAAVDRMHSLGGNSIHISISHIKTVAVAVAILQQ